MDSSNNERGLPPSLYTTTLTSTTATASTVISTQATAPTAITTCASTSASSYGKSTSATSDTYQVSTVAIPTIQGQPTAAVTQSSAAAPPKLSQHTSPVAAITASAVSNTVLAGIGSAVAACGTTVGLDSGDEIGASGGGVAGLGGGQIISSSLALTHSIPTTTSSSMDKGDPVTAPTNPTDSTNGAALTSSPKLLRPAVFDKVCEPDYKK